MGFSDFREPRHDRRLTVSRIALLLTLAGCGARVAYSPPPTSFTEDAVTVPAAFDPTWNAVVQTFFQRNLSVRTVEKESGILESDELRGEIGRDCDCGSYLGIPIGGYAGAYGGDAYYRFRVLVERHGEGESRLTLRSSCKARTESVEGELVCRLLPQRESELRQAILDRIRSATPPSAPPAS